jgi:hypothetical protein
MKVKKVNFLTEEARDVNGIEFLNSTEDAFPYVESALNSLDNNFKWWKEKWPEIEQLIAQYLDEAMKDSFELKKAKVTSRFTMFHGTDERSEDVVWTGPAIVYTFIGGVSGVANKIKNSFGGMYEGRKIFVDGKQLIILFG